MFSGFKKVPHTLDPQPRTLNPTPYPGPTTPYPEPYTPSPVVPVFRNFFSYFEFFFTISPTLFFFTIRFPKLKSSTPPKKKGGLILKINFVTKTPTLWGGGKNIAKVFMWRKYNSSFQRWGYRRKYCAVRISTWQKCTFLRYAMKKTRVGSGVNL